MRDLVELLVQHSIGPGGLALGIDEDGESETLLLPQGLELPGIVGGDRPELGVEGGDLVAVFLQLTELLAAVRSPAAAEEDQDEGFLVAYLGQRVGFAVAPDEGSGFSTSDSPYRILGATIVARDFCCRLTRPLANEMVVMTA